MIRLYKIILLFILASCTQTDYRDKIIGRWEIDKLEVEFEGTPDPEAKTMLAPFNVGITFFKDGTCKGIEPATSNHPTNYYHIGGVGFPFLGQR